MEFFRKVNLTFAKIERNGFRVNVPYLKEAITSTNKEIKQIEEKLKDDEVYKKILRKFGSKTKLGSKDQLAFILFNEYGYKPKTFTEKGKAKLDKDYLESTCMDLDYVKNYLMMEKLRKAANTYLKNILDETDEHGFLHPFFHIHTTTTLRTSSSGPNFQNMPIRDPVVGKLIRNCFIPRSGRSLIEIDYGAMEFRIAACFWKDPEMVSYASDPTKDIHRDEAMSCYLLEKDQVSKNARYCAKNKFVFPILYGSSYAQCAKNLWLHMQTMDLRLANDNNVTVMKHLKSKGIKKLGLCDRKEPAKINTYEYVVKRAEENFNNRFKKFCEGKEIWWKEYERRGAFRLMTGFLIEGIFSRNFLMNTGIQGPASHCLDWSIVEIQKEIEKRKLKVLIVAQIHDCVIFDCLDEEIQEVMTLAKEIMTQRIRQEWKWILTPLEIEADLVRDGETWHDKKPWIEKAGMWIPK